MGARALTWGLTLPLAGAGVLLGHDLAYRLAGVPDASGLHGYLSHAPQLVAILLTVGLVGLAFEQRTLSIGSNRFVLLGATVFVTQEHLERLVHDGSLPFLLSDRTFLLGMLLQLPIGLACLGVARVVSRALRAPGVQRRHLWAMFWLALPTTRHPTRRDSAYVALRGRSPPMVLRI